MKALSAPPGTARFPMGNMPKLTDMILSIKVSDVNAYFRKSDLFCTILREKDHPPCGVGNVAPRFRQNDVPHTVY
ncbi:MAG: hypothetical protein ACI3V2_09995 [Faecousia sp.]